MRDRRACVVKWIETTGSGTGQAGVCPAQREITYQEHRDENLEKIWLEDVLSYLDQVAVRFK